jgi:hypothetical protein
MSCARASVNGAVPNRTTEAATSIIFRIRNAPCLVGSKARQPARGFITRGKKDYLRSRTKDTFALTR